MTEKIFLPQPIIPPGAQESAQTKKKQNQEASFAAILEQQSLKFSRHATERILKRGISLTPGHLQRLYDAVEKAAAKGAQDSLILVDNFAFVVSVKNRTVVTAIDGASLRGNVFTNIDSAVIV
jgi:flagellar operon protein